jgi:1-acyl-sn-glycerol-3-phosphate acyltransferase
MQAARKITTSSLRDLPEEQEWKTTSEDPFCVASQAPLWRSIPILIFTFPITLLSLLGLGCVSIVFIATYRHLSGVIKDRMAKLITWFILLCGRLKTTVIDHSDGEHAQLFVSNHICMLEGMMILNALGHIRFIAAEFSKNIPMFGILLRQGDPIWVQRNQGKSNTVQRFTESLEKTVYRHLVFPEGTYNNGSTLLKFKSGAFVVKKPITPVLFSYPGYVPFWNREESSFFVQIYRLISRLYTPVVLEILPVYQPNDEELADPKLYAENVRKYMSYYLEKKLSIYDINDSPNYKKDTQ